VKNEPAAMSMPTTTAIASSALNRLAGRLSRETRAEVHFDRGMRGLYATDASLYQIEPLGVVVPRTSDDVIAVVSIAAQEQVPNPAARGGHEPVRPDRRRGNDNRLLQISEPDRDRRP
jgi:hypothetical protein